MKAGECIGSYRIVRLIGAGGMGKVYEAHNDAIGRRVAIKILDREQATDKQSLTRFMSEARLANQVSHPGLVTVHEFGRLPDGGAFLVMEYLEGETLASRLHHAVDQRISVVDTVRFAGQIADALASVHSVSVVHRDIKPANLMLVSDSAVPGRERVKILDFGLAKDLEPEPGVEVPATRAGIGMGTPSYIAPEQIFGANAVDDRADIYALGAVMFELLAGHPPFVEEDERRLLGAHVTKPPQDVRELRSEVPARLADLIAQMLRKQSEQRPTAREVADVLESLRYTPAGEFPAAMLSRPKIVFSTRRFAAHAAIAGFLSAALIAALLPLLPGRREQKAASPAANKEPMREVPRTGSPMLPRPATGMHEATPHRGVSTAEDKSEQPAPVPVPKPSSVTRTPRASDGRRASGSRAPLTTDRPATQKSGRVSEKGDLSNAEIRPL